ncbi:MAG: imidazole glycerol phosphate synthase subunit HisH [Gammaproteobacteria bacterium]
MQRVAVVDYGGSNLRSVAKAVEHVATRDVEVQVCERPEQLRAADRIVFPGQGAIGDCMKHLRERDLVEVLRECVRTKPFFGICLGLQSLMTNSDEDGGTRCLEVFAGGVKRFAADAGPAPDGSPRKIPHMGWNEVHWTREHPVTHGVPSGTRFYFVHSYYVVPADDAVVLGRTDYIQPFCAALASGSAFATQFHPEKSAEAGLRLLANFLHWQP